MPDRPQTIDVNSLDPSWPSQDEMQESVYTRRHLLWRLLFVLLLVLYVAFIKLSVGYPVRTLLLAAYGAAAVLFYQDILLDLIRRYGPIIYVTVFMGALGSILTLLHGADLSTLMNSVLAELFQPLLIFITVYVLTRLITPQFASGVYILVAVVSGVFCLLQFYGLDVAWQIRENLGRFQGEPLVTEANIVARGRPVGLSLTPITFSYHVITAYLLASFMYRKDVINFNIYALIVIFMLIIAAANGTRSLLLGIVIHEVILHAGRREAKSLLLIGALVAVSVAGFMFFEALESRITTLQDASALGRLALYKYGLLLALDNPLGFGWNFDPGAFAWQYWEDVSDFVNSDGVFRLGIHNGLLGLALTYGVFGLAAIIILAVVHFQEAVLFFKLFAGYLAHMFFHNAGIFIGEYYFWFILAIILVFFHDEQRGQREAIPAAGT